MKKVLLIRTSAFRTTRVIRQAKELGLSGFDVSILHWERMNDKSHNDMVIDSLDFNCSIHTYKKKCEYGMGIGSLIHRLMWFLYVTRFILSFKPTIVHAVDFDSALPVLISRLFLKFKLVYDIADYIETFDSNIPFLLRKGIRFISERVMKYSSLIVIPDLNRMGNIPSEYKDKIVLVNNAPNIDLETLPVFTLSQNQQKAFDNAKLNVFYYGAFNEDRAIRLILDASINLELQSVNFWFAGWGALEEQVKNYHSNNVFYLGKLKQVEAISLLSAMDVSLIFYDPAYEHNRLASPNKIFEAMAVGTPVLVAYDTSIDKLVLDNDIGYVGEYNANAIVDVLTNIEKAENELKRIKISSLYLHNSWEQSAEVLRGAYEKL